jgi:hypothetical protein
MHLFFLLFETCLLMARFLNYAFDEDSRWRIRPG